MMALPKLPDGYRWRTIEPHKIVFHRIGTGKSYGVRGFGPGDIADQPGVQSEIAYGVAKIERELERDRAQLELNQD